MSLASHLTSWQALHPSSDEHAKQWKSYMVFSQWNYIKWRVRLAQAWEFLTIHLEENEVSKGRLVAAPERTQKDLQQALDIASLEFGQQGRSRHQQVSVAPKNTCPRWMQKQQDNEQLQVLPWSWVCDPSHQLQTKAPSMTAFVPTPPPAAGRQNVPGGTVQSSLVEAGRHTPTDIMGLALVE